MKNRLILGALCAIALTAIAPAPSASAVECCGRVANLSSSSASVRAYFHRADGTRFRAGNCNGDYINVYPGSTTNVVSDLDCIRMYSGSTKVTGIVKVIDVFGRVVAETNVGCTSNRVDIAVHGSEVGRVYYARKCA